MKRLITLALALLMLLTAPLTHADSAVPTAPAALDMASIIEMSEYEFDFLPWYTPLDDAVALFGLTTADYLRTDLPTGAVVEFSYPSALTGADTRVQLLFELIVHRPEGAEHPTAGRQLVGIRTMDTYSDLNGLCAHMDAISERWNDMLERKVLTMQMKRMVPNWASAKEHIVDNDPTSYGFGVITGKLFADANGVEREARLRIQSGASDPHYRQYIGSDAPYYIMHTYTIELPDSAYE